MDLGRKEKLIPQEEMLEVIKSRKKLTIGIPKEVTALEKRIALVPNAVGQIVQQGHEVLIERGAGDTAHFSDHNYSEEGGQIVNTADEVYQADIILKVSPLSENEIDLLRYQQTIISSLQLTSQNKNFFKKQIEKKTTALAFEYIKDKSDSYPVLLAMSEIVGKSVMLIAGEYQCTGEYGKGNMLGGFPGITPSEVVVIGAGTVGLNAARTAVCLGCTVKVYDNNIYKLRKIQTDIGSSVYTSIIQPKILMKALKSADVVIGAIYADEGITDCIVTEDMVRQMKQGSMIIDVSIDQGGCFETSDLTTHKNPVFKKFDVTHYCVPNIASKFPHTASYALSNFFTPVIIKIGEEGGIKNMLRNDYGISRGVFLYNGTLTKKHISQFYDLPFQDLDLLMAAF
ncbi:MAG: alanine dehydrogenase [Bacteroidales bacterium]|nr:alanine dehydrogenase [Bacteroidales bacterium]MCF8388500.1 alanine dehydrogenase [Bacteroidales bacterium]MCF8396737.1 alanine dehydrogenase [Bacteroidales bacterium]